MIRFDSGPGHLKKKLFLLGSGFLKDVAGIPTLCEISEEVEKTYSELPAPVGAFLKTIPKIFHKNIEDLLSYLAMDFPWSSGADFHLRKATFFELSKKFASLIKEYEQQNKARIQVNGSFKKLVEFWHDCEADVITFNYDTLVERVVFESNPSLKKDIRIVYVSSLYSFPLKLIQLRSGSRGKGRYTQPQAVTFRYFKLLGSKISCTSLKSLKQTGKPDRTFLMPYSKA